MNLSSLKLSAAFITRIFLILYFIPVIFEKWFFEFFSFSVGNFEIDPWIGFLNENNNNYEAFPYGYILYFLYNLIFSISSNFFEVSLSNFSIIYLFVNLIFEILLVVLIKNFVSDYSKFINFYVLNPVPIYILYIHGQNDILPVYFIFLSIYFLKTKKVFLSAIVLSLIISTKIIFIVIFPIFLLYVYKTKIYADSRNSFVATTSGLTILQLLLYMSVPGYVDMISYNQERLGFLQMSLNIGNLSLPLLLIIYFLILFQLIRYRVMYEKLLLTNLIVVLFSFFIFNNFAPGWSIWFIYFLLITFFDKKNRERYFISIFSYLIVMTVFINYETAYFQNGVFDFGLKSLIIYEELNLILKSLVFLAYLILLIYFYSIDYERDSKRKFRDSRVLISISGDSGSGKDTLAESIQLIIGEEYSTKINGDDFHLFERNSEQWNEITHLNPKGNDLYKLSTTVSNLLNGRNIKISEYNHQTGKFDSNKVLKSKDYLILNSLHGLYIKKINELSNLKIFLNPDQSLKTKWKIDRDTKLRNKNIIDVEQQIESRSEDFIQYIFNQRNESDITFSLINDDDEIFEIEIELFYSSFIPNILSSLDEFLQISAFFDKESLRVKYLLKGKVEATIIEQIFKTHFQQIYEILPTNQTFQSNHKGIMQIFSMALLFEESLNDDIM